jgi:N-acetylmuramoyl-L-alanine amidase
MTRPTKLTIHCAATKVTGKFTPADVKRWDIERFGQASYHLVIAQDGSYERHLRDDQRGAHVGGHNTGNIGICYIGGLDANGKPADTRTREQKVTMRALVKTYLERFPGIDVLGHRDWPKVAKECPCFSVRDWIKQGMPTG